MPLRRKDENLILEQILVDNEIACLCQRLIAGIDSIESKDLYDDVVEAGPGGHFLLADSTRKAIRSGEFYISKLIPHYTYDTWLQLGQPTIYTKARDKVKEILMGPMVDPLPEDVTQRLDEILLAADLKLCKDE